LSDRRLLGYVKSVEYLHSKSYGQAESKNENPDSLSPPSTNYRRIAVCGAHMHGLPLNQQLLTLGARFYASVQTTANYRLYALAIAPPERPGLVRDETQGRSIALELWELPKTQWAAFIGNIKSPLCLGAVELADGQWEYGFLCENYPIANSVEITQFAGWRNYLQVKQETCG
jgi:allophanate hydrolase